MISLPLPSTKKIGDRVVTTWDISKFFNQPPGSMLLWRGAFGGLFINKDANDIFFEIQAGLNSRGLILPGFRGITGDGFADPVIDRVISVNNISADSTFDPHLWLNALNNYFN